MAVACALTICLVLTYCIGELLKAKHLSLEKSVLFGKNGPSIDGLTYIFAMTNFTIYILLNSL